MKRLVNIVLCMFVVLMSWAQMSELTLEQHLEDYDFAVKYLEDNYAVQSMWKYFDKKQHKKRRSFVKAI